MATWLVVLTSAAVGAVISTGITLLGQVLERRDRRKELFLTKAIELALYRDELAWKVAQARVDSGKDVDLSLSDAIIGVEVYYKYLEYLWTKGGLPDDPTLHRL